MIKLLRRLFGASEGRKVHPCTDQPIEKDDLLQELREAIINPETRPTVLQALRKLDKKGRLEGGYRELYELLQAEEGMAKGLNALSDLALGKEALAESIIGRLASDKDLAQELGGRAANQDERMVLNLWWVTLCVMRAVSKVSDEEKRAFLDQYHEFIYFMGCPECEDARSAWAVATRRISALSQTRYQEYFNAFGEMMRRQEALHRDPSLRLVPGAPLMRAIIKNLFGLESDSLLLTFIIQTLVMNGLIAFAKTFGTPEAWATMRHFLEEACRALRSGATKPAFSKP
jgi:hypothetical protein